MNKIFDAKEYWMKRHRTLRGDVASVGTLGTPKVRALQAAEKFQQDVEYLAKFLAADNQERSVLDIGCGYGRVTQSFLNAGYRYYGVDLSPDAIEEAKAQYPDVHLECSGLAGFKPNRRFFLTFAGWVLIHIVDDAEWETVVNNIAEWTELGGFLCIIEVMADERTASSRHVVNRTIKQYEGILEGHGIKLDTATTEIVKAEMISSAPSKNLYVFRKNGQVE